MPISEGFLGTANNGIGQGLGYVLPDTKSEDYALQLAQQEAQRIQAEKLLRAKQAQELKDDYSKDIGAVKSGDYWSIHDKQIKGTYDSLLNEAAKSYATTGKNPLTTPEYLSKINDLKSLANASGEMKSSYEAQRKIYDANPDKFYPESMQKVEEFVKNNSGDLKQYSKSGLKFPSLQRKFDINDFLQGATPESEETGNGDRTITEASSNKNMIQSYNRLATPAGLDLLKQNGGSNRAPTFEVVDVKTGIPTFPKDRIYTWETAGEILSDPALKAEAKTWGVDVDGKAAQIELSNLIERQNKAAEDVVKQGRDDLNAKVSGKNVPDNMNFNNRMAQRRLALSQEREARIKATADTVKPTDFEVIEKTFTKPDPKDPKKQIPTPAHFSKYVAVNPVTFGTSQVKNVYDVYQAKNTNLDGIGGIEITGVGWGDVKGGDKGLLVSMVDSKGNEYIMDEANVPLKVKNDKYYKAAVSALGDKGTQNPSLKAKSTIPSSEAPKKGQEMKVQGGTAIFDGTKWIMK